MKAKNKIDKRRDPQIEIDSFNEEDSIGLFTFYKQEDPHSPFQPSTPTFQQSPSTHSYRHMHSLSEHQKYKKHIFNFKEKKQTSKGLKDSFVGEVQKERVTSKLSKVLRLKTQISNRNMKEGLGNVVDINFSQQVPKKSTRRIKLPIRVSTEIQHLIISKPLRRLNMKQAGELTSQQVKQLFQPKKQIVGKLLQTSLSIKTLIKNAQNHQPNSNQIQLPNILKVNSIKKLNEDMQQKSKQTTFLNYLYQQKNMMVEQFLLENHKQGTVKKDPIGKFQFHNKKKSVLTNKLRIINSERVFSEFD